MSASLQAGARKKKHKICLKKSQKILNLNYKNSRCSSPYGNTPPKTPPPCPLYIVAENLKKIVLWPLNVLVHKPDCPQNPPSIFESLSYNQLPLSTTKKQPTHSEIFCRQYCLKIIFCNKKSFCQSISFRQFRAEI